MNRIEHQMRYYPQLYVKKKQGYYMSYIDGTVLNPHNGKKNLTIKNFLLDTGAAITILNRSFNFLFKDNDTPIVDHVNIRYGGGTVNLPVYDVILKIKGVEFNIPAAFDKNMELTSLLGHLGFLNEFEHFSISKKRKKITLIK